MTNKPNKVNAPWAKTTPRGEHGGRYYHDTRYNTRRWKRMRHVHLLNNPWCVECLKKNPPVYEPAKVLDHIKPVSIGGDFWSTDNHQGMCTSCHNSKSGKEGHL